MTIAGSDSSGGSGVEADLKTFCALGVYGTCVVTSITAQNTKGVYEVFPAYHGIVKKQIEAVLDDIPIKSVKTGVLYSRQIMRVVSESIEKYGLKVVVDPVLRAGTGNSLISENGLETLIDLVLPKAYVLTPNIYEAEAILKTQIKDIDAAKEAAQKIAELGAEAVIVKGGHLISDEEKVYDVFYHNGKSRIFSKKRIAANLHGCGCVFSAAITGYLALGADLNEAVEKAESFIEDAIRYSVKVGQGRIPVNPTMRLHEKAEMFDVINNIAKASEMIEAQPELLPFIAEVGTQIAMAIPHASSPEEVAAIEGRIVKFRERPKAVGSVRFGVSRHVASIILTAMRYNPQMRAALNLHYDSKLVKAFRKAGFKVSSFDRRLEPSEVKSVEGRSIEWGVEEAIKHIGEVPDIIFDEGDFGKEPMIRVLGRSATEVVNKTLEALKHYLPCK